MCSSDLEIKKLKIDTIKFLKPDDLVGPEVISNTLKKDASRSEEEALETIYRHLRSGDPPDIETARSLIDRMFFNAKRYDLGSVGRYRMNKKLGVDIPIETTVLSREDIVAIIKYLLELRAGIRSSDDIDHLGNRRIKTVGEQLAAQMTLGFSRMARTIKERMNLRDSENLTPQDLVNARTIFSVINTFFGTSQLSQFMDQTNPLAELTHKRRLSALGPGGLTQIMSEQQFKNEMRRSINAVPHVRGFNNHMGSLLTKNPQRMAWVMQMAMFRDDLYFVDSRTTRDSVALQEAEKRGIRGAKRDVFLDYEKDNEEIVRHQLKLLIERARKKGTALAIGHPYRDTLKVLEAWLPTLKKQGVRLVSVSDLISIRKARGNEVWQLSSSH